MFKVASASEDDSPVVAFGAEDALQPTQVQKTAVAKRAVAKRANRAWFLIRVSPR
jgi:hypothetical protein